MLNQRVVFLEADDEVTEAINILKKTKKDVVVFVIPQKANFFQSIINARILRNKAEELNKQIFVVTRSKKGQNILKIAGIPSFESLEHLEATPENELKKIKNEEKGKEQKIHHINVEDILEKEEANENDEKKINWREIFSRPSKSVLFGLILITFVLFFFVSTLALPGATIYIKPERKTIPTVVNVTLMPAEKIQNSLANRRKHVIAGYKIEATFDKEIDFQTISKIFTGKNAEGQITVINAYEEERSLMPNTRFQSDKGVVYRIDDWIKVPPAQNGKNGEITVTVKADEKDIYGDIVGEKGNITENLPQKLTLPGLPESAQAIVWAEVREPLNGGVSSWQPVVKEDDLEMAKKEIEKEVTDEAQTNLERYVREKNTLEGTSYQLVPESKFMQKKVVSISTEDGVLDTDKASFKVNAEIVVSSWAFNESDMLSILRDDLEDNVDPGMFLEKIDPASLSIDVFSETDSRDELKINVNAKGVEAYLIEARTPAGLLFDKKIKETVKGKSHDEAENILVNFPEISDVKISLWPFFSTKIPQLEENIDIKLWEE